MGTAVLLPQDCLPSYENRHKYHFSDMIYRSESAPRARRNSLQASVLKNAPSALYPDQSRKKYNSTRIVGWSGQSGLLPLSDHGSHSLHINMQRKGGEGKKSKARKPAEQRDVNVLAKPTSDVPVFTILQRPKHKEAADELIAKFMKKVDGTEDLNELVDVKEEAQTAPKSGVFNLKVVGLKHQNRSQNAVLDRKVDGFKSENGTFDSKVDGSKSENDTKVDGCKVQKGVFDMKIDGPKPQNVLLDMKVDGLKPQKDIKVDGCKSQNVKIGASKPTNFVRKKGHGRSDDLARSKALNQLPTPKVAAEHKISKTDEKVENFSCKAVVVNQPARTDSMLLGGLARLRRASSTDPQTVNQLLCQYSQYRSEVMEVPFSEAKLGLDALGHGFTKCTASMSCHERWAGPAYSSSPAPSSLPLPKFSLPNSRASSLEFSPLVVEQYNKHVYMQPSSSRLSVPMLPTPIQGGAWDVAFATKSLRRMLNLDPC